MRRPVLAAASGLLALALVVPVQALTADTSTVTGPAPVGASVTAEPGVTQAPDGSVSVSPVAVVTPRFPTTAKLLASCPTTETTVTTEAAIVRPCNSISLADDLNRRILTPEYRFGHTPQSIESMYKLPKSTSTAVVTVVVVTGRTDNPEADLAKYRARFGLPACTTANGCFEQIELPAIDTTNELTPFDAPLWAIETALDLDAVSAACPTCKIRLIRAGASSFADIDHALKEAVRRGGKYITSSYVTGQELPEDPQRLKDFYTNPDVMHFASSGDFGDSTLAPGLPQSSPHVFSAGGTRVTRNADGSWKHVAWKESSSSCSTNIPLPAFQTRALVGCDFRAGADISALGDPATGLATYNSFGTGATGWAVTGGTSLSAPLLAGMAARLQVTNITPASIYRDPSKLQDVVEGDNAQCEVEMGCVELLTDEGVLDANATYTCTSGDAQLCFARRGWDGPTGYGTPVGPNGFKFL